jgi:outer membrane protein TolC
MRLPRLLTPLLVLFAGFACSGAEDWSLERALTFARTNNPDARLARSRIHVAQAGIDQANSAFWPKLQFQSSYTRTDNPMLAFGSILNQRAFSDSMDFNDVPDTDDLNVRGIATVPIYVGGRNKANTRTAEAASLAAKEDEKATLNILDYEVARSFFTIQKTREFARAAEASVIALRTNLDVAGRRLDAGSLLKTDVLDIEVRLAEAKEDHLRAQNANAIAIRSLRNLLGIEQGEFAVADGAPDIEAPGGMDFSGRAELAAARERERAAQEQVRAARGNYLPRLSAFGSLDYDYGWELENGGRSYTVGGLLQWDIWDGSQTRAKVREARANLESSQEATRKTRLMLDLEIEQARLEFNAASERVAVTAQMIARATESASLTRARFDQGAALASQLIDAETALLAARVREAEARADRRVAVAALRKALGLPQMDIKPHQETK